MYTSVAKMCEHLATNSENIMYLKLQNLLKS